MRLRRLVLSRYGMFTDHTLDFGERNGDGPDLHLVYGLNEAGKSTALAGFLDLLFGIEQQSRYHFLHGYESMRIESDLEALVHLEGLAMRAGPRPRLDPGAGEALPPGCLKVDTTGTPNNRGFSLRVYSPESSDGTLSVLSMTSGREKVYFPSLPMLNRYLPRCSDEIEIYRTTLCRIGLDIGKFDLKQRPWLPRHTVLNQLDDLARGVQALADCYGKRGE